MKRSGRSRFVAAVSILAALVGTLLVVLATQKNQPAPVFATEKQPEPTILPTTPPIPSTHTVVIRAAGDLLIHSPIIDYAARVHAQQSDQQGYDFTPIFKPVAPILQAADYTIVEQEVPMGDPKLGYAGYPRFNSPKSLAVAMKQAGVDMATTANNHSLDQGIQGIRYTLEHLEAAGLDHVGTYRTPEEASTPLIKEINGIKIAFFAYTYGTNGIPIPPGQPYLVYGLDPEKIKQDIESVRNQVDFVIVSPHWGDEYARQPNDEQKRLARNMIAWGADVIIGDHVHVIQPMEWIEAGGRRGAVIYSTGNLVSNQIRRYSDTGVIFEVVLSKTATTAHVDQMSYIPVWVDRDPDYSFRVLPIEKALADYASKRDPRISPVDAAHMEQALQDVRSLVGISFERSIQLPQKLDPFGSN